MTKRDHISVFCAQVICLLLDLCVDADVVVRCAAETSLRRLALYMDYRDTADCLR